MEMVAIGYPVIMLAESVALKQKTGARVLSMVQPMDIIVRYISNMTFGMISSSFMIWRIFSVW